MTFIAKLAHALATQSSIPSYEQLQVAVAAVVAIDQGIERATAGELFVELASRLRPRNGLEGLAAVQEWLREPELSHQQLQSITGLLPNGLPRPMDWTAELAALIESSRYRDPFIPISTGIGAALGEALQFSHGDTIACINPGTSTVAWGLARTRPVTLHVSRREVSFLMSLLAFADGRPLQVSTLNPIEFLAPPDADGISRFRDNHYPLAGQYDHIVTVPPLGYRVKQGDGTGMLAEAWQVEQLAPRAAKSFVSLATDGLLFRESRSEAEFRERLIMHGGLSVTSLPPGFFGRASGVQVNLLQITPNATDEGVTFIDGRSMERMSRSGREQEDLIIRQFSQLGNAPRRYVAPEELAENNFNLLPSRYIVTEEIARVDEMLADRKTVRLGDVARIIRSRAPQPVRGDPSDTDLVCLEIAVADITDGKVGMPSKEVRFPPKEGESVKKVMVRSDDILVSIKGNVGAVGLVDANRAILHKVMGTPEVISQSLAIVRLEEGSPIKKARVLAGILASPQMRAKLQTLAAGTTVPTLPISALQDLQVPVPDEAEAAEIDARLDDLDAMQGEIDERVANRRDMQDALWRKFWNISSEQEEA